MFFGTTPGLSPSDMGSVRLQDRLRLGQPGCASACPNNPTHPSWGGWMKSCLGLGITCLWVVMGSLGSGARAEDASRLFPDPAMEAAVRSQVFAKRFTREPLTEVDVAQVSTVVAHGAGIRSLAGLEKCRSLAMLELPGNRIVDLGPLANLTRLQYLDLRTNAIVTLTPLASVAALQYLNLSWNRIEDVGPLQGLTNLTALHLSGNRLTDLGAVYGLSRLTSLYVDDNRLVSIEGIGRLKALTTLSLSGNRLSHLRPMESLESLQYLFLARNRVEDLADLLRWLEGDREHRFAPFLQIDLEGNPLGTEARRRQWNAMKTTGVRLLP